MYPKFKFLTFTERNMARKIALELDSAQRRIHEGDDSMNYLKGCFDRCRSYLDFAQSGGRMLGYVSGWKERLEKIYTSLNNGVSGKTLFQDINNLYYLIADFSGLPVGEHRFKIKNTDSPGSSVKTFPCTVVMDNLRSAFNVGAIMRTCDGMGIEKILMTGITPTPDNPKVKKTAMGSDEYTDWEKKDDLIDEIKRLKKEGKKVYVMETVEGSKSLFKHKFSFPVAVVLGNEEFGVMENVLEEADEIIHIPMFGKKNSFNVGVSFGMFSYEARSQWENAAVLKTR
ncbi:MAG: RNA methyltransferase [Spirochaetes bacterium]|nr:RNA methyltransferase [Spirochaetota bacterium]